MIPYEKYHGTGNEFVVVDADEPVPDRSRFATGHCDRETGIGADGVLFLALEDESPLRVEMTLYQPDGDTAAMCGNGARCAAEWATRRRCRPGSSSRTPASGTDVESLLIETPAGTRTATLDGEDIAIEMGAPSFSPADVPLAREEPLIRETVAGREVSAIDTGVPHAVAFVDDVGAVDLESIAPQIRHADAFPEGANVTVASPTSAGFDQRTYERGVEGETRSCGTGAVAIAAVARRLGLAGERVTISPPGGDLDVWVPDDGAATLRGPVVFEGSGEASANPAVEPTP